MLIVSVHWISFSNDGKHVQASKKNPKDVSHITRYTQIEYFVAREKLFTE
jgi:hypothetical protein